MATIRRSNATSIGPYVRPGVQSIGRASYAYDEGDNSYLRSILLPFTSPLASIPDEDLTPHVLKRVLQTKEITGSKSLSFLWTPATRWAPLTLFLPTTHPITGNPCLAFKGTIPMDEEPGVAYSGGRLVSAGLSLASSTLPSGSFALNGQMTATMLHSLVDSRNFDATQLTSLNSDLAVQAISVKDGLMSIYLPEGKQEYKVRGTDSTLSNYSGYRDYFNAFQPACMAAKGNSWFSGDMTTLFSSRVDGTDYIPGFLRGRTTIKFSASGRTGHVSPPQVYVKMWRVIADASDHVSCWSINYPVPVHAYPEAVSNNMIYTFSGEVDCITDGFIDKIEIGYLTNGSPKPPDYMINVTIQNSDIYQRSEHVPAYIITLTNFAADAVLSVKGVYNFELIPDSELAKELSVKNPNKQHPDDFFYARQMIMNSDVIKPYYNLRQYNERSELLRTKFVSRREIAASASGFGDIIGGLLKPIAATAFPLIKNIAEPLLGDFLGGLGLSSERRGYASGYGRWKKTTNRDVPLPPYQYFSPVTTSPPSTTQPTMPSPPMPPALQLQNAVPAQPLAPAPTGSAVSSTSDINANPPNIQVTSPGKTQTLIPVTENKEKEREKGKEVIGKAADLGRVPTQSIVWEDVYRPQAALPFSAVVEYLSKVKTSGKPYVPVRNQAMLLGIFPLVSEMADAAFPAVVAVTEDPLVKIPMGAGTEHEARIHQYGKVPGTEMFVNEVLTDNRQILMIQALAALSVDPRKKYITLSTVAESKITKIEGCSFGGALACALSGLTPTFAISAVADKPTERGITFSPVGNVEAKLSHSKSWGVPLLICADEKDSSIYNLFNPITDVDTGFKVSSLSEAFVLATRLYEDLQPAAREISAESEKEISEEGADAVANLGFYLNQLPPGEIKENCDRTIQNYYTQEALYEAEENAVNKQNMLRGLAQKVKKVKNAIIAAQDYLKRPRRAVEGVGAPSRPAPATPALDVDVQPYLENLKQFEGKMMLLKRSVPGVRNALANMSASLQKKANAFLAAVELAEPSIVKFKHMLKNLTEGKGKASISKTNLDNMVTHLENFLRGAQAKLSLFTMASVESKKPQSIPPGQKKKKGRLIAGYFSEPSATRPAQREAKEAFTHSTMTMDNAENLSDEFQGLDVQ